MSRGAIPAPLSADRPRATQVGSQNGAGGNGGFPLSPQFLDQQNARIPPHLLHLSGSWVQDFGTSKPRVRGTG